MQGVINIFGDIGEDVTLVDVIQQVKKQPNAESFIVNIDSPGGYLEEGFAIYDYLKSLNNVHTKGRGVVASSATIIFMAGQKRSIYNGTQFMIHFPFIAKLENAGSEDLDRVSKMIKEDELKLTKFYSRETNIEEKSISSMLRSETFLNEDQLFDLGFTTEKETAKIAAKLIYKEMNKDTKKEGKSLLDKIKALLGEEKSSNKILFASDEREVEFPDVAEDAEIQVGDTVMIDGTKPEDGSIILKDGRTIVIVDGKVDAIEMEKEGEGEGEGMENTLATLEGKSVTFPDLEEDGEIVGQAVLVDGEKPNDGTITLNDGRVVTVVDGKVEDSRTIDKLLEELEEQKTINKKMTSTLKEVEKFQSKLIDEQPEVRRKKKVVTPEATWSAAINQMRKN